MKTLLSLITCSAFLTKHLQRSRCLSIVLAVIINFHLSIFTVLTGDPTWDPLIHIYYSLTLSSYLFYVAFFFLLNEKILERNSHILITIYSSYVRGINSGSFHLEKNQPFNNSFSLTTTDS